MRKLLFVLSAMLCLASAGNANVLSVRSLNAAAAVVNGVGFAGQIPNGGGTSWSVLISGPSSSLTVKVEALQTDGTWIIVQSFTLASAAPAQANQYQFNGPYLDMRVIISAYTSGSITADIFVSY